MEWPYAIVREFSVGSSICAEKVKELKSHLKNSPCSLNRWRRLEVSFKEAHILTKQKKPFTDHRDYVHYCRCPAWCKDCGVEGEKAVCRSCQTTWVGPGQVYLVFTAVWRVVDSRDTAQLAVFIRMLFWELILWRKTKIGDWYLQHSKGVLSRIKVPIDDLVSVRTDGAPATRTSRRNHCLLQSWPHLLFHHNQFVEKMPRTQLMIPVICSCKCLRIN